MTDRLVKIKINYGKNEMNALRMYLWGMSEYHMIASTLYGLESTLADELKALGATGIEEHTRAVSFGGDKALLYRANLHLRTALRVLIPIARFEADDENALYEGIRSIDWQKHMRVTDTFAVYATVNSADFTHSHYTALRSKDAIADHFREKRGRRPNVDLRAPKMTIRVHIFKNEVSILIDSSGDSLHMRGYRMEKVMAPLNEVLAAGMIKLSGWQPEQPFVDPMCGSGTLAIEAALMAMNKAPGLLREHFAFQGWKDFDHRLWEELREEATAAERAIDFEILAADKEPRATSITRQNMERAGVKDVTVIRKAFKRLEPPQGNGIILMNPPYGERMKEKDNEMEAFYKMIGDQLKQEWKGYTAWILSSNKDALKRVGLRTSRKLTLFNGPLECKFHCYELY